jgi:uroporphyrinogen-III synthase
MPKGIKIACIGDATAKRLCREYMTADVVAAVNDVGGLLKAIEKNYSRRCGGNEERI